MTWDQYPLRHGLTRPTSMDTVICRTLQGGVLPADADPEGLAVPMRTAQSGRNRPASDTNRPNWSIRSTPLRAKDREPAALRCELPGTPGCPTMATVRPGRRSPLRGLDRGSKRPTTVIWHHRADRAGRGRAPDVTRRRRQLHDLLPEWQRSRGSPPVQPQGRARMELLHDAGPGRTEQCADPGRTVLLTLAVHAVGASPMRSAAASTLPLSCDCRTKP
jgi:hypothetical protein